MYVYVCVRHTNVGQDYDGPGVDAMHWSRPIFAHYSYGHRRTCMYMFTHMHIYVYNVYVYLYPYLHVLAPAEPDEVDVDWGARHLFYITCVYVN